MRVIQICLCLMWLLLSAMPSHAATEANRLAYLDEFVDPYYVGRDFPKLITPQWVGEDGVEAVVVLAIDDMRDTAKYEAFLRPILDRLKSIDGRAALSIMTNEVDPEDPQLQAWLQEGVSLEVHTIDHPCPCLKGGNFEQAKSTYERCVDLMSEIAGNRPVAFRMPCCDSQNTPSPRFWAEIFNRTTADGNYLSIDSSVFHLFTRNDNQLPLNLVEGHDGEERFRKYLPFPSFVNTIEDYPYPYVIGRLCWEFPCVVPSDWEAQNLHQPYNPETVHDLNAALDATVQKRGVFNLVFHPHGWIRNDQVVEFIDHAVSTHGSKVKFLSFREALDRLNDHLLKGQSLRATNGQDNGVRLLDVNRDGYLDVVMGNETVRRTRVWSPDEMRWKEYDFPAQIVSVDDRGNRRDAGVHFAPMGKSGTDTVAMVQNESIRGAWVFAESGWERRDAALEGLAIDGEPVPTSAGGHDTGFRMRDVDGDGSVEAIISNPQQNAVFALNHETCRWERRPWSLPEGTVIVDDQGRDAGLRMVDLNEDGRDDILFSNQRRYSAHLFESPETGWSITVRAGNRGDGNDIPMIVRDGTNNGAWFHSGHLWVQNEDTDRLPDVVDRLALSDLNVQASPRGVTGQLVMTAVGAARIDITPNYPIRLSGYGNRRVEASEIAERIWARAIAIGDDEHGGPAVLINVENCGVPGEMTEAVAAAIRQQTGLARARLVICSTHTHAAPWLNNSAPFLFGEDTPPDHQQHVDRYTRELTERLVHVAIDALNRRKPATLAWTQGQVGFAANRRVMRDGRWDGFGTQADGPVDHRLPVLVAKDNEGKVVAVLANYACHCTTLGGEFNQISGDWAGYAQDYIERDNPEAVALVVIGCGADANPHPRGNVDLCKQHGRELADEVQRLLQMELRPVDPKLDCRLLTIDLPFDTLPTKEQWEQQARQPGAAGYHARAFLRRLARGDSIEQSLPYPVATWTFGDDLAMVFLGGEVVVDYAIRLHEEFDSNRLWVTSYANDVPCYIASKRILREGGYEADSSMLYYARPTRFAPEVEDLIVDTVQKLLPHRFYSPSKQQELPPPLSPEDSLAAIKTRPGMKVELAAAEPLIEDPVAFDWGPDGRLWVVEMRDYPNGMDNHGAPGGRVKVLDDVDGDGRYDRAATFLDKVPYPMGIKVWRRGILVTAAPRIFYAEDTDGDDRADVVTTLYEGFGEGNQQHRVNGLRWGLDNWLYVGNGDSGGSITATKTGQSVNVRGRDVRIRPDDGLVDPQSGQTQFGLCQDDWGNWFGGNNSEPIWHYVLQDHYLRRNPHLAPPNVRVQISDEPGAAPVYPASRTLARFNDYDRANRFTSACSPMIYRDVLLGDEFHGNAFVCEPVHNLVYRQIVEPHGVTFTSHRAEDERRAEFLASSVYWFRPAMVRTGPDGAIWIADMYRFVIEHPQWIPALWQRKLDVRAGDSMGRIYRVYSEKSPPRRPPRLDQLDTAELVAKLDSPNGWQRDMVQQMLLWRNDPVAVKPLEEMAATARRPQARLHALCTLDGLNALSPEVLRRALSDEHPGVRRHAVRLTESRIAETPSLAEQLLKLVDDPDPLVRMQLAYTLGYFKDRRAGSALGALARHDQDNEYVLAAVMSSVNESNLNELLTTVLDVASQGAPSEMLVKDLVDQVAAMGDKHTLGTALDAITRAADGRLARWQYVALVSMLDALGRRGGSWNQEIGAELQDRIRAVIDQARAEISRASGGERDHSAAVRLLGKSPDITESDVELLGRLLQPQTPAEVQREVVAALGAVQNDRVPELLLSGWNGHSPGIRSQVLNVLMSRDAWTDALLTAIERGTVQTAHVDAGRRQQLIGQRNRELGRRAEKLFALGGGVSRQDLVEQYQDVVRLSPDRPRGKAVFEKHCAVCHQLDGTGHAVGPDLTALTDNSTQAMLTALLDPNRAVEDKFHDYLAITTDGRQWRGILTNETGNSIVLTGEEGKQQVLLRNQLEELHDSGKSLMPEGMEKDLSKQDMADVFAYVRAAGPAPRQFPGNQPATVSPGKEGTLDLLAANCSIFGTNLMFEPRNQNLGWWRGGDDRAVWSLSVPTAGRFRVLLDYASDDVADGNRYVLTVADQTIKGRVRTTGSWDEYKQTEIGVIQLPAGDMDLEFRSDGPIRYRLIHLRAIRLEPVTE